LPLSSQAAWQLEEIEELPEEKEWNENIQDSWSYT
jgi:hypothetical protein